MKKFAFIAFGLIAILSTESCNKDTCYTGNEYRVGSTRYIEPFNQIDVNLSGIVEIIKDTTPFIEFIVEGNLEQYIATPVNNKVLSISLSECFKEHQDIIIRVHYDTLNTITTSGPGDVISNLILEQDSLVLNVKSSGDISLTTNIKNLYSNIQGTGIVSINGQIEKHTIELNNSGAVNTYQAMTQNAVVNSTASGNIYVRVKNTIKGELSGSGDLFYKRNPIITVVESSTGKVINDN